MSEPQRLIDPEKRGEDLATTRRACERTAAARDLRAFTQRHPDLAQ